MLTLWSSSNVLLLVCNPLFLQPGILLQTLFPWTTSIYILGLRLDISFSLTNPPPQRDMDSVPLLNSLSTSLNLIISFVSTYSKCCSPPFDQNVLDVKDFLLLHGAKHMVSLINVRWTILPPCSDFCLNGLPSLRWTEEINMLTCVPALIFFSHQYGSYWRLVSHINHLLYKLDTVSALKKLIV